MQRMIWAVLIAFLISLIIGPLVISWLKRLKMGQQVYKLAPSTHQKKQGTPTMGGFLFAGVSLVVALVLHQGAWDWQTDFVLVLLAFALLNLLIGFVDDFFKIRRKNNQGGLSERQKIIPQMLIAIGFSVYCYYHPQVGSAVVVPFFGMEWDLGLFYIPFMVFVIICTTNGTNLLDGLDGLSSSVCTVIMTTFGLIALFVAGAMAYGAAQDNLINLAVLLMALAGALLGFLRFNFAPAQVIMGDTGSMFLGGMVVGAAMLLKLPLLIPLAGGAILVSLLSVFIQRMYFKATHGKRIFKNSPLHHHLELIGMPETRIVAFYTIATIVLCLISFLAIS